jgi:hypothetical protein
MTMNKKKQGRKGDGTQKTPPSLMDRTRAAAALVNAEGTKRTKMFAFLSIFHHDLPLAERLELANDAARDDT